MMQHTDLKPSGTIFYGLVLVPGGGKRAIHDGAIYVKGPVIQEVGESSDILKRYKDVFKVALPGFLVCPGFVNAHTHAAMSFFRDLGHDRSQAKNAGNSMIEDFFFPTEEKLSAELIEPLAYSYLVDGLKSGVTSFGDAYFYAASTCRALQKIGLRGAVGEHHADLGGPIPSGPELWKKTKSWFESWDFPLIQPVVYAHATDTVSKGFLKELTEYARSNDLPFHMHLSQTTGERDRVMKREGISPVAYAEECGALGPKSLLVHLLSVDDEDISRLQGSGSTAGLCPISEILYEKPPEAQKLMAAGIPIALGTDCAASDDGADVHGEARFFGLHLRSLGLDHQSCSPQFLLDSITLNGAKALGLESVGFLAKGMKADLVFMKGGIGAEPQSEPEVNLMFSLGAKNVRHVMVNGKWSLFDGELCQVSEGELHDQYIEALKEIKKRSHLPIQIPRR